MTGATSGLQEAAHGWYNGFQCCSGSWRHGACDSWAAAAAAGSTAAVVTVTRTVAGASGRISGTDTILRPIVA